MVKEIFGDMLYCPDLMYTEQTQFPSPESLKGKVMISTKPPEYRESRVSHIHFTKTSTVYHKIVLGRITMRSQRKRKMKK